MQKPCLIETGQGFSVLYNERFLYSKYNPANAILRTIEKLNIKENTLVLCFSPVLFYGLTELIYKLPKNCFILALECDENLYNFSLSHYENILSIIKKENKNLTQIFSYEFCPTIRSFSKIFDEEKLFKLGNFKRCITLNFSAGTNFKTVQYDTFTKLADDFISTFWKNRITLIKMGRLYAKNIFKNIIENTKAEPLIKNSVKQNIIVFGAGPSLDNIAPQIKKYADNYFIISVDASTIPLLKHGIIPDRIIAVESQIANEKSFIGLKNSKIPLIADLTSRTNIINVTGGDKYFFLSEYAKLNFLDRLKSANLVNFSIPPVGSVGLAAMEIALFLRYSEDTKIFFCGLDFCFEVGKTHCKESSHITSLLNSTNRIKTCENLDSSFQNNSFFCKGKDGKTKVCNSTLLGYAKLFSARYSMKKNIFDIGDVGIDIGSRYCSVEEMIQNTQSDITSNEFNHYKNDELSLLRKTNKFYETELNALKKIKAMLTGKDKTEDKLLEKLLIEREYLYLHFPDAHLGLKMERSFLKRIRAELDFFIKDIEARIQNN